MSRRCLGGVWEVSGKCLGGVWEVSTSRERLGEAAVQRRVRLLALGYHLRCAVARKPAAGLEEVSRRCLV